MRQGSVEALHDSLAVHTPEKEGVKSVAVPFETIAIQSYPEGLSQY